MEDKKPKKHSLASYAYEKDWFFMTDLIDTFKGTKYSEKAWDAWTELNDKEKKVKKFWRR